MSWAGVTPTGERFRILHVCTGNTSRSPIAERLMRHGLAVALPADAGRFLVDSAGTWGHVGAAMEAHAAATVCALGGDAAGFRARELADEHVITADLVLTATREQRAEVVSMGHGAGRRTFTLKEYARLAEAVSPGVLPAGDPVARARVLVGAAGALRGRLPQPNPAADDMADPYGGPLSAYQQCAAEIASALRPVIAVLTGVPARIR